MRLHYLAAFSLLALSARADETLQQLSREALSLDPIVSLSPSGRFVAIQDAQGVIRVEDAASGRSKLLVRAGAGKATFSWSPHDNFVFVTRSGRAAAYDVPSGRLRSSLAGNATVSLLEVSPDGRFAAFVRDNNLWIVSSDGRGLRPLTRAGSGNLLIGAPEFVYAREFGVNTHFWWAPDSSQIAFIETEFPTADHYVVPGATLPLFRLKVVDVTSGQVRSMAESNQRWPYLLGVAWHPDGKRIAFYRLNRMQTIAELCLLGSNSFNVLLTEKDDYWVNAPATPVFVEDGKRIVVSSERSGGRHVYLYDTGGALVGDLTPAGIEVYRLHDAVDTTGGVYVSGSTENRQEQQLFRLDLQHGAAKQITSEAGWHEVSLGAAGGAYLDRYSSVETPPSVRWHGNGGLARDIFRASVVQKAVANEYFPIRTHNGVQLPARLFKPHDFDAHRRYPVILYTFAGPGGRVVSDCWGGWQMAWNRYLVDKGYLVLAVDVRGSGGYGHLFEEYIHYRFGAQEVADLREVLGFLRRQTYVDGSRLGIWGCDYGAHIVVHAMLQFPGGFRAGIADSPIVDWTGYDAYFTERYLGLPTTRFNEYRASTVLDDAGLMTGTLMVVSSAGNPMIRKGQVEALQGALSQAKKKETAIARLHLVDETDANYREDADELAKLLERMTEFFDRTL